MEYNYKTPFGKSLDNLEASKEMEIYRNLQALKASFHVFGGNFHELMRLLEPLQDSKASLMMYSPEKRENLDVLVGETKRLFHNFLASSKTLIDHTRVVVNRLYSEHEFQDEYQQKVSQDLANHPLQKFVQNLRNYTHHYTLPIEALQITYSEDLNFSMRLDVNALKVWGNWGSSLSYLESFGNNVCLATLVTEYFVLIQNFYNWLAERQTVVHQADLANLQRMQRNL
jgi:hypothetical protein